MKMTGSRDSGAPDTCQLAAAPPCDPARRRVNEFATAANRTQAANDAGLGDLTIQMMLQQVLAEVRVQIGSFLL